MGVSTAQGLAPLEGFNVDVAQSWVTPKDAPFVVSSLLHQDSSTNQTWLLVTSPQDNHSARFLHRCTLNTTCQQGPCTGAPSAPIDCQPVEHVPMPKGRHQGVTIARNRHGVLICIQVRSRTPHSLTPELTGACSLLGPDFQLQAQVSFSNLENLLDPDVRVDARDCYGNKNGNGESARCRRALEEVEEEEEEEAGTEIAIVLDGSGSISPPDFQKAKDFISKMMRGIYEKCFECSFALVQYGTVIQTEFDLRDSQDELASLARVQNIIQVGNVTKTASAMQHVLDNVFTPSGGSRERAAKVMVVLTDGDIFMDPLNLSTVISSPKMKGVERFAIGVGDAFQKVTSDRELKQIASDETHAFKVTNYSGLEGLLSRLQQKIIHVEGAGGDAIRFQLAQVGFSAELLGEKQVLLGAVGAFNWSGGALLYNLSSHRGHFLQPTAGDSEAAQYCYLGYSVAVLHRTGGLSYVAGAPKHLHHGAVFESWKEGPEASFLLVLEGDQMGSYFGSELCPVDIDMDGTTDFLLVAAPFYHVLGEEGRVYMYRVNQQAGSFSLAHVLSGHPGFKDARFGFAMAALGDISQDKFTDVAIGAPLEGFSAEDGASFGSVYIYNGHQDGLSAQPSQRIRASQVDVGLRYFGMSLSGGLDISSDGLVDITVGTLGQAAVLRSKPVVRLKVSMNFSPKALPVGFKGQVTANLCFETSPGTPATETGLRGTALNFTLDVDVTKQWKRLKCPHEKACLSILREWSSPSSLCEPLLLLPEQGELPEEDYFSNISIKVSYQLQTLQADRHHPQALLDHYTEPWAIFQLPQEKSCKNVLSCDAELQLDITAHPQDLVIGLTSELTVHMNITNHGEDSYMTNLTLKYPTNLQFKRIQKPSSLNIQCDDPKPGASALVMSCKIGHPIFKRSSSVSILAFWQLEEHAFPNQTADIAVTLTSANGRSPVTKKEALTFKRAFIAALTKPSVMYMNTSQRLSAHKEFLFSVHGENRFGAQFQLQVCVPLKIQGLQVARVKNVTKTQADTVCTETPKCVWGSDLVQHVEEWYSASCAITSDKENVTVAAELFLAHAEQLLRESTELWILGEISYDKTLYEGLNAENHRTKITVILLKDKTHHFLLIILGSSLGGLLVLIAIIVILFKCGFFKRKYHKLNLKSVKRAQLQSEDLLTEGH
ncbi:integrin alpha-E [Echinops telfairi]|uniref:Integrin alpha-E n=1 Tax=Echinops telfairi TaxID=9371 RepID=A0AC55DC00_ECHTE|nr:integrin alpha-E [Echinops telfairi]